MSQPAARLGDPTAHGGVVAVGSPNVLVNGQPAAGVGDLHVCPMCSPGPHVGGPILVGSPTVLVNGKPMARVGDACACAAPAPDVILAGSPNVLVGGSSAAVSPGAAAAAASAHAAAADPGAPGLGATARPLSPWVGVAYLDAQGRPLAPWRYRAEAGAVGREGVLGSGAQVWLDALGAEPDVTLVGAYGCRWSRDEARVGDEVALSVRTEGVPDGAPAHFTVERLAVDPGGGVTREAVAEFDGVVQSGRAEADRPFAYVWDPAPSAPTGAGDAPWGAPPTYAATAVVDHLHLARSGPLRFRDWVEFEAVDTDDRPLARRPYVLRLASGEVRTGTTDAQGAARVERVPPGDHTVEVS